LEELTLTGHLAKRGAPNNDGPSQIWTFISTRMRKDFILYNARCLIGVAACEYTIFRYKSWRRNLLESSNLTWTIEKWCQVLRVPLFLEQKYQTFRPKFWDEYDAVFAIIGFRLEKLNM
jgi:hypothetical protein